ncbi:MAG: hypothetical protein ACREX8_03650 [Gammaproteobacteria bacterium]
MIEHVLDLEALVHDPTVIPEAELAAVKAVVRVLDEVDQHATPTVRDMHALTATVRAILAPHWRNRGDGTCAGCSFEVRPAWPCPAWRAAHRWLIELDPVTGNRYEDGWFLMAEHR